ncbi:SIS domain-containing protein [Parafrigoribacterium soli]|uniref:SIS domain-containing protein n=1 Tax=Parafrigoribacterium soli TaxID=3144663 RepID=UPI0032EBD6FD
MSSTTDTQLWPASGAATVREILQQPDVWREASDNLVRQHDELQAFLSPLLARPELRIVLTGAGTSAFVGSIAAPALARLLDRRVEAIATTDIVSNPELYFAEDVPTLLVSFARSGNSPESIAATELADTVLSDVSHLIVTCAEAGTLSKDHAQRAKSKVVLMPARANDEGFAMTSSFSSMLLSSLLIFSGANEAAVASLEAAASRVFDTMQGSARELAARGFERVVYLGSGPLTGLARESALKLLELTAGTVVSYYDSSLGFRHGPKSVLNDNTLVIVYVSSDPYTRHYDLDIITELQSTIPPENLVVISALPMSLPQQVQLHVLDELRELGDAFLSVAFVTFAQLLALSFSVQLGLTPDNPFPGGTVNRVVKGVQIYPLGDV